MSRGRLASRPICSMARTRVPQRRQAEPHGSVEQARTPDHSRTSSSRPRRRLPRPLTVFGVPLTVVAALIVMDVCCVVGGALPALGLPWVAWCATREYSLSIY